MTDSQAWLDRAQVHEAAGEWDEAVQAYTAALTADPHNAETENALGLAYEELGKLDHAEAAYASALRTDPNYIAARYNLAMLYRERDCLDLARQEFEILLPMVTAPAEREEIEEALAELANARLKRCALCGRTSPLARFYRVTRHGLLCPRCYEPFIRQVWGRITMYGLGAAAIGALLAYFLPFRDTRSLHYALLNGILVLGFGCLLVVPHELAHALATWLVGGRVYTIHLGAGPVLFQTSVLGVEIVLHRWLYEGCCTAVVSGQRWLRWRWLLVFSAGLLFNIVTVAVLLPGAGLERLVSAYAVRETLILASLLHLLLAFTKDYSVVQGALASSDGAQVIALLQPAWKPDVLSYMEYTASALWAWQKGNYAQCKVVSERGLAEFPGNLHLRSLMGLALLGMEDYRAAIATFEGLVSPANHEAAATPAFTAEQQGVTRASSLNNLAWALLCSGVSAGDLQRACDLAEEGYGLMPWSPAIEGTFGILLAETRRPEEGLHHLLEAYKVHTDRKSRASTAGCLALTYARLGHPEEARRYLDEATKNGPEEFMVRKAREELSAGASV